MGRPDRGVAARVQKHRAVHGRASEAQRAAVRVCWVCFDVFSDGRYHANRCSKERCRNMRRGRKRDRSPSPARDAGLAGLSQHVAALPKPAGRLVVDGANLANKLKDLYRRPLQASELAGALLVLLQWALGFSSHRSPPAAPAHSEVVWCDGWGNGADDWGGSEDFAQEALPDTKRLLQGAGVRLRVLVGPRSPEGEQLITDAMAQEVANLSLLKGAKTAFFSNDGDFDESKEGWGSASAIGVGSATLVHVDALPRAVLLP